MDHLYPPSPAHVPRDLTRPTRKYRLQVVLVLLSLLLSFALYLALIVGSGWLCYWLVTAPWPARREGGYAVIRIAGIIGSGLLFLYLVKGLFKTSSQDDSLLVEITEEDQPDLFAFIRRVCAEARAPFPHKVFISPDVNAGVFYHSSLLSLIWPTPKNLVIGLGLVNMLNLSEFKAVLAHEFGHFSQRSMKVGSYVYVANRVLAQIVYGRDFLDNILREVKHWDIRIAVFVYAFLGILWCLRKILEGIFKVINLSNLSLMRQMEFNADRVAIAAAGSDAMVLSLLRAGFADQAFRQLSNDLWSAADHELYSRDIFHHQQAAAQQVRRLLKKPDLGVPPAGTGPSVQVFKDGDGDVGIPPMWATHPSNFDREQNAKATYLQAPLDERSCWVLFHDLDDLRLEVSQRYYRVLHKLKADPKFSTPQVVQQFLDEEYAETTYDPRYAGYFDNRYLEIKDLDELLRQSAAPSDRQQCQAEIDCIFSAELGAWVDQHNKRLDEFDLLTGIVRGVLKPKGPMLEIGGQSYPPQRAQQLLDGLTAQLDKDRAYLEDLDGRLFVAHCRLARQDAEQEKNLVRRYRFHLSVQEMFKMTTAAIGHIHNAMNYAGSRGELSQNEFAQVRQMLIESANWLHEVISKARGMEVPPLKNIPEGLDLGRFLLQKPRVRVLGAMEERIPPEWVTDLMNQLVEVQDKLKRLTFKSLGGILAAQERIRERVQEKAAAVSP